MKIGRIGLMLGMALCVAGLSRTALAKDSPVVISVSSPTVPAGGTVEVAADFHLGNDLRLERQFLSFEWKNQLAEVVNENYPTPERLADPTDPKNAIEVYRGDVHIVARLRADAKPGETIVVAGTLHYQLCTATSCYAPTVEEFAFKVTATGREAVSTVPAAATGPGTTTGGSVTKPATTTGPATTGAGSAAAAPAMTSPGTATGGSVAAASEGPLNLSTLLANLFGAFLGGLLISLTPCVYPMIPITAAVIGARKEKGLANALGASIVYVLGMAIVYAVIGLAVAGAGGNTVSTFLHRPVVLVPLAALFVALAVVTFSGMSLGLPSGSLGRLQSVLAGKRSLIAIFALGAVGGLIIGPCATPLLAAMLTFVARTGNALLGFWMFFLVAVGMGIPLIVVSMGTGLLPKAGPWMAWFKRLIGFLMLWAGLFILMPVIGDTAFRIGFGVLALAAAVVLGEFHKAAKSAGLGARLKNLLGLAGVAGAVFLFMVPKPPTSFFVKSTEQEVEQALAEGQPMALDFSASWCIPCKVMEKEVFSMPEARRAASGVAALNVDFDASPALVKRFQVEGVPRVLFIDGNGRVREDLSITGAVSLDEFVRRMERFVESVKAGGGGPGR